MRNYFKSLSDAATKAIEISKELTNTYVAVMRVEGIADEYYVAYTCDDIRICDSCIADYINGELSGSHYASTLA